MNADTIIDTNILVYMYDVGSPAKQEMAFKTVDQLITSQRAALPVQVLAEFFVVVTQKIVSPLSPREAMERVDHYLQCTKQLPLTGAIVREAARGVAEYQLSYWDAQIWACARLNQIQVILTEDLPGREYLEGVRYRNPFRLDYELCRP